jgi:hypothetical protein
VKHVGYAIQNKDGKLITTYRDILVFDEKYQPIKDLCVMLNEQHSSYAGKIVRVLIDDEVESE